MKRFTNIDTIYEMLCNGEGVIPTKTTQMYWIVQDAPGSAPEAIEDENAGKWLIFQEPGLADEAWIKVRNATVARRARYICKSEHFKAKPGITRQPESHLCIYKKLGG